MDKIKILFLTYAYPPQKHPRSVQISHWVQYLRKEISLNVVTSRPDTIGDPSLLSFTPLDNVQYAEKSKITRWVEKSKGYRIKKAIFPDLYYLWHIDLYRRTFDIVRNSGVELIVSFGQPMSTHIAALKLKRKFPYLKWVAHFSDPWVDNTFNEYNHWTRFINKHYQDAVFHGADNLIFTSEETINLVTKPYYSVVFSKSSQIPHCFNSSLYPSVKNLELKNPFVIRYLGNFYGDRQPKSLFEALRKIQKIFLKDIRVEIVGSVEPTMEAQIKSYGLEENVFIRESVNYLDSLKLMCESDLLLVIDAPTVLSPFLPSKLIDYIGANKPIFGITPSGTSQKLIEAMGFLVADPRDPDEIAKKLSYMIEKVRDKKLLTVADDIRNQYSIETVGEKMYHFLRELCTSS